MEPKGSQRGAKTSQGGLNGAKRELCDVLGAPGGSRSAILECLGDLRGARLLQDQKGGARLLENEALWASRGRFSSLSGARWGPEGTLKSTILASSRHKWLQKEVREGVPKRFENGAEKGSQNGCFLRG